MWSETLVGAHIRDNDLRMSRCGTSACGQIILNYLEVSQKFCIEPMVRDDPQLTRDRIRQLYVAAVGPRE
jgi:hypothetical protein